MGSVNKRARSIEVLTNRLALGDTAAADALVSKLRNQVAYEKRLYAELQTQSMTREANLATRIKDLSNVLRRAESDVEAKTWFAYFMILAGFSSGIAFGLFALAPYLVHTGMIRCTGL